MSASDYIELKRIKTRLGYTRGVDGGNSQHTDYLPPVLSSQDYTDFVGYGIESTVLNDNVTPSLLAPPYGPVRILDMDQPALVPLFPVCSSDLYQERWNRVLNPTFQCGSLYSRPLTQKQQDVWQGRVGCPQRTTLHKFGSHGRPLQWPGDNRIKQRFVCGFR